MKNTNKIAIFGEVSDECKQLNKLNWKKTVVNYIKRNVIGILRLMLWWHRMFGLTFGGLVIASNGSQMILSTNKYYKWYGCLMSMALWALDASYLKLFDLDPNKVVKHFGLEGLPKMTPYLFGSIAVMWGSVRMLGMYQNNINGYEQAQFLYKAINYEVESLVSFKVVLVPLSWSISSFLIVLISIFSFHASSIDHGIIMVEFIFSFGAITSVTSIVWMISLVYNDKLDMLKHQLRRTLQSE